MNFEISPTPTENRNNFSPVQLAIMSAHKKGEMHKFLTALLVLFLAGCSSMEPYTAPPPPADPLAVVERYLNEQPERQRPESVRVTNEYFEVADATWTKHGAWFGRDAAKQKVVRVYYSSIGKNYLFSKGRWWYVRSRTPEGTLMYDAWSDNKDAALRYLSALEELKRPAK
ncbi:hypothetical protein AKI39_06375 [Bordetella sp. H567]|uniref:hypothetical protein n=1 Tax=Bordetella sp. H567 TaxID=1697043 RepID=UPI00081C70BB|nr:hypothetical protein [Bordetella sp. H567]AOB30404.1 hypothetical protein AKI39_06375 [Bordetella sp. H567]